MSSTKIHAVVPVNARRMRAELEQRLKHAEELLAESPFFERTGGGHLGVVAAGPALALALDQAEELGVMEELTVQQVGGTHPLPRRTLENLLGKVDRVLVFEELSPFIEDELRALAHEVKPGLEILGKRSGARLRQSLTEGLHDPSDVIDQLRTALDQYPAGSNQRHVDLRLQAPVLDRV